MSFIGAIAQSVRKVLSDYAKQVTTPNALIIGAGNFTVPLILRSTGYTGEILACDVSLYTSALGAYLSGQTLEVSERSDCPEQLRGLLDASSPLKLAASIALMLDLREVWKCTNPWQENEMFHRRQQWAELKGKTCARLEKVRERIGEIEYQPKCGFALLQEQAGNPAQTVITFPPTYKRGYERLEKLLTATCQWQAPSYAEMTDKSLELYELIARFESYYVVLEKDLPEVHAILGKPVAVLPRGAGKETYILAKEAPARVMRTLAKSAPVPNIWSANKEISGDEEPSLVLLSSQQMTRLKELYMSVRVNYTTTSADLAVGICLDGQLIGMGAIVPTAHAWKLQEAGLQAYLMADIAVSSCEPRLSKLVLSCLLSSEVKQLFDEKKLARHQFLITTAFSAHSISMKYRGLFKLHKRIPKDGMNALNYFAPWGKESLAQGFKSWLKKYKAKVK